VTGHGWGWGDYWGAFVLVVLLVAWRSGDAAGWWILLALAGVGGYVGLNILQAQIEAEDEDLDREPSEIERLEESIESLRRVARDFRAQHEVRRALELEAVLRDREDDLVRALETEAQPRRLGA
jgi:hypothetical protein